MTTKEGTLLTGDRPTGRLHIGHYAGSMKSRVELQAQSADFYYMIADMQALTDNADDPVKVRNNVFEVALDNLACGLDPAKATYFIQSGIPEIAELALYFLNLVTLARLERNPTVKDEMRNKGFGADVPAGFLVYPVSQAADILSFRATRVPVGIDQLPMLEQANEIAHKFNTLYGETFAKIEPLISTHETAQRLPGLDGKMKMSKSLNNAIYIADSLDTIKEKVNAAYTDPLHVKAEDPGHIEGNVVFSYLDVFDTDSKGLAELKASYTKGGVGDVAVKRRLIEVLDATFTPIREKREYLAKNPDHIMTILKEGTEKARAVAQATLRDAKRAMKINYFE